MSSPRTASPSAFQGRSGQTSPSKPDPAARRIWGWQRGFKPQPWGFLLYRASAVCFRMRENASLRKAIPIFLPRFFLSCSTPFQTLLFSQRRTKPPSRSCTWGFVLANTVQSQQPTCFCKSETRALQFRPKIIIAVTEEYAPSFIQSIP